MKITELPECIEQQRPGYRHGTITGMLREWCRITRPSQAYNYGIQVRSVACAEAVRSGVVDDLDGIWITDSFANSHAERGQGPGGLDGWDYGL